MFKLFNINILTCKKKQVSDYVSVTNKQVKFQNRSAVTTFS